MQLRDCGVSYDLSTSTHPIPNPSASTRMSQPTGFQHSPRLSYRGIPYQSQPQLAPKVAIAHTQPVTLVYRGQPYQIQRPTARPYQQPRALNWRWQSQVQS